MVMAVVDVETFRMNAGRLGDQFVKSYGVRARREAGAMLADIDVEEDIDTLSRGLHRRSQVGDALGMIDKDREAARGIRLDQASHAGTVGPDQVVSEQHVRGAA